jgi:hypothetical protein
MKWKFVDLPKCKLCPRETDGTIICRKCRTKIMMQYWETIAMLKYPQLYREELKYWKRHQNV